MSGKNVNLIFFDQRELLLGQFILMGYKISRLVSGREHMLHNISTEKYIEGKGVIVLFRSFVL